MDGQEIRTKSCTHDPNIRPSGPSRNTNPRCHCWEEYWHDYYSGYAIDYYFWGTCWIHVRFLNCYALTPTNGGSLVVNIIAGEIVEPVRRTAVFGKLQGAIMLGQGLGYLSKTPPLM